MPELVNVTCTDDAVPGNAEASVSKCITATSVVPFTYSHDEADVPLLGVGPTFAVHRKPEMKLVPVMVIVLVAYAYSGVTCVACTSELTITPDADPIDVAVSPLVVTVIPVSLPEVVDPIVSPAIVSDIAVL